MNKKTTLIFISTLVILVVSIFFVQLALPVNAEIARLPDNTGLREESLISFIETLIKTALGIVGSILLILIIYGGFTYATAAGSEEKVKKGRQILTYAIIGIVIIAVAWILTDYIIGNILLEQPTTTTNNNTNTNTNTSP